MVKLIFFFFAMIAVLSAAFAAPRGLPEAAPNPLPVASPQFYYAAYPYYTGYYI